VALVWSSNAVRRIGQILTTGGLVNAEFDEVIRFEESGYSGIDEANQALNAMILKRQLKRTREKIQNIEKNFSDKALPD